jgi:hypothetical protein
MDATFTGSFSHYCNYLQSNAEVILITLGAIPSFFNIAGRYVSLTTNVIDNQSAVNFGLRADHTILVAAAGSASILSVNPLNLYSGGRTTTNDPLPLDIPPINIIVIPVTNFASNPTFI